MALTGYTEQNIQGSLDWWMENVHATDRKSIKNKLESFIKAGEPYCDAEYRFRCANNKYSHFLDKGYIIYRDGKPIRAIGVVHDITEKKALQAKLLRQKVQKQKDISRAIIAAQEHVCNELSKELHDNVNQLLAAAGIMLKCAQSKHPGDNHEYLNKGRGYVRLAIDEIRKISKSLNTSIIGDMGLVEPIRNIIYNMELNHPVKVRFDCDEMLEQQLYDEQKLMLYRIIQEQSNNIMKYAEASEVSIDIKRRGNSLQLVIQDNGKGFDIKKIKRGVGLSNIRNRVESFSGSLNIVSSHRSGCRLEINVPFREKKVSTARK
jgi:PAS domain S-box-containing protein